jgi:hypothetical protein
MDIRVQLFQKDAIVNRHRLARPMFERHSDDILVLFGLLLSVLDRAWSKIIVGITTDAAANMTGSDRGAASRIECEACKRFYRTWCGLHQLDIVVQRAVSKLYDDKFYGQLTAFIEYLRRQQILYNKWCRNAQRVQLRAGCLWAK